LKCLLESKHDRFHNQKGIQVLAVFQPLADNPSDSLAHLIPKRIHLLSCPKLPTDQEDLFLDDEEANEILQERL